MIINFNSLEIVKGLKSLKIIPHPVALMFKLWKKIRKWYQSHTLCLQTRDDPWKYILEQAELANETWYMKPELVSPARDSLSNLSNG